jgi:hypothetical protein
VSELESTGATSGSCGIGNVDANTQTAASLLTGNDTPITASCLGIVVLIDTSTVAASSLLAMSEDLSSATARLNIIVNGKAGTTTSYRTADSLLALHTTCASTTSSIIGEHPCASTIAALTDIAFLESDANGTASSLSSIIHSYTGTTTRNSTAGSLLALNSGYASTTSSTIGEHPCASTIAAFADVAFLESDANGTASSLSSIGNNAADTKTASAPLAFNNASRSTASGWDLTIVVYRFATSTNSYSTADSLLTIRDSGDAHATSSTIGKHSSTSTIATLTGVAFLDHHTS